MKIYIFSLTILLLFSKAVFPSDIEIIELHTKKSLDQLVLEVNTTEETDEDLKRELNSAIKDMERQKPSLIEDVQKGKSKGSQMLNSKQKEYSDYKNKRARVEVKYE